MRLLIGSRAIRIHLPEFREPRDWDLVGTQAEIDRLASCLTAARPPGRHGKACFRHDATLVEVANATESPYWGLVLRRFAEQPTIEVDVLGRLNVAPLGYLLLTKQCGLVYRITHWHKNLEDFFYMQDRIASIPSEVAELVPHALEDSRQLFESSHLQSTDPPMACHPDLPAPADRWLHEELHRRLALGSEPLVADPDAWQGFPALAGEQKRAKLIQLFAEEAMVVAAERLLHQSRAGTVQPPEEARCLRWSLRALMTGKLPVDWRYFGVNHYREIQARIPQGWAPDLGDLRERLGPLQACDIAADSCS